MVWYGVVWYGMVWYAAWIKKVIKSNIFGHILTEIYKLLLVLSVFALFGFHVHVAGSTLST